MAKKIQKFNYYHLPTNRRLSKFHSHISNNCLSCPTAEETDDHIVWCNSNDRLTAKHIWEQDIFHFLSEKHTPNNVRTAIMTGFHHWIYNKPIPPILQYCPTAPSDLQKAYNDQTRIGWNHFVRGRISIHWQKLITHHLRNQPPDPIEESSTKKKKKKSDQVRTSFEWASRLIVASWHGILILWDLRNRSIHGAKGKHNSTAEKSRLLQEARSLLDIYTENSDHFEIDWFKKPLEELEKYSVISLKAWVRNARMMVRLHRFELRTTSDINFHEEGNLLSANSDVSTGNSGGNISVEHR